MPSPIHIAPEVANRPRVRVLRLATAQRAANAQHNLAVLVTDVGQEARPRSLVRPGFVKPVEEGGDGADLGDAGVDGALVVSREEQRLRLSSAAAATGA